MEPGELLPLALYLVQQLGIMLGVGSATVFLISYLVSMRDGVVEIKEAQFARVVQHVLEIGLVCIVLSGAAITALHTMAGEYAIISSPAYFFKWVLVAFVSAALVLRRAKPYVSSVGEGLVGATWYALFILHVIAPIAFWTDLLFLYAAWIAGFMLLWVSLSKIITTRAPAGAKPALAVKPVPAPLPVVKAAPAPVQKPVPAPLPKPPVPPIAPKPVLPAVAHAELAPPRKAEPLSVKTVPVKPPAPHAAPAPAKPAELVAAQKVAFSVPAKPEVLTKNTDNSTDIPHVYVMPRTPEDVEKHLRSAELQLT